MNAAAALLALCAVMVVLPSLVLIGMQVGTYVSLLLSPPSPATKGRRRRSPRRAHSVLRTGAWLPPPPPPPPPPRRAQAFLSLLRAPSTGIGDRFGAWANVFALAVLRGDNVLMEWPDAWRRLPPSVALDVVSAGRQLALPPFVTLRTCTFARSVFDLQGSWHQLRAPNVAECKSLCQLLGAAGLRNRTPWMEAALDEVLPAMEQCKGLMYHAPLKRCQLYSATQPNCLSLSQPAGTTSFRGRSVSRSLRHLPRGCASAPHDWSVLTHSCVISTRGGGASGSNEGGSPKASAVRLIDLRPSALAFGAVASTMASTAAIHHAAGRDGVGNSSSQRSAAAIRHRMGFANMPHLMCADAVSPRARSQTQRSQSLASFMLHLSTGIYTGDGLGLLKGT